MADSGPNDWVPAGAPLTASAPVDGGPNDWVAAGRSAGATALGYGKAAASGLADIPAHIAGLPMDLYNMAAATETKLPAWLMDKAGLHDAADWWSTHGPHGYYSGSSPDMVDTQHKVFGGYNPTTPGEQLTHDTVNGAGTAAMLSALGPMISGSSVAPATVGSQAVAGGGAVLGGNAAGDINNAAQKYTGHSLPTPIADLIGSIFGAKTGGGIANRTFNYDKPDIVSDMDAAGVNPHFASDVNTKPGLIGQFFSNMLPGRLGAQASSQKNAASTQSQLSDYAEGQFADNPTLQQQGQTAQALAVSSVERMQAEIKQAYLNLNKTMGSTTVPMSNTNTAVKELLSQTTDPAVTDLLQTPQMQRLAPILSKPNLSWPDLDAVRREVGGSMNGQTGSDLGKLQKLYGAISDDMRSASNNIPGGQDSFTKATNLATDNNAEIDDLRRNIIDKVSPETLPGYLTQQVGKGDTRLTSFFKAIGPGDIQVDERGFPIFNLTGKIPVAPAVDQATIGKQLLGNAALNKTGDFDLPTLMKFFTHLSPEGKAALMQDPQLAASMNRVNNIWEATANSRALANAPPKSLLSDPLAALSGVGGLFHAVQGGGATAATAIAAGYPAAAGVGARISQLSPLVKRLGTSSAGPSISPYPAAAAAAENFPDTYTPPAPQQHAEAPTGGQVQAWLGSTDRASAASYVGSKLGPQIGQQIASTDDNGYKAALFSLFADPTSRKALSE